MITRTGLLMLSLLTLSACVHDAPVQTTFSPAYPERNGAGDPIVAVFNGRIPCETQACDKRKVALVVYGRDEGRIPTSYWLSQVGIGNDPLVQQGTWAIRRGVKGFPGGLVYALDLSADPTLRYFWRLNNDIVLVLGPDLSPRVGNAAWGFMLSRDCAPYGPRTYPYDERTHRFLPVNESNCRASGS